MDILLVAKNSEGKEYVHEPTPSVVINVARRHKNDTDDLVESIVTWTITGILLPNESGKSIDAQVAVLETYYGDATKPIIKLELEVDSTTLEELASDNGIKLVDFSFPDGKGPEWATRRRYTMVFEGEEYSASIQASGEYDYSITYATEQSTLQTRTISGALYDFAGQGAAAKYATLKSDKGWATWTGGNLISDVYNENSEDTKCTFTIIHKKYWQALPSGITNANVQTETRTDTQNVQRTRISGWLEGSAGDCATRITALIGSKEAVHKSIVRDDYAYRTSFNLELINLSSSAIMFTQENLSIEEQVTGFVYKRILGGADPIKQTTSKTSARASQSGTITKFGEYASVPAAYWNTDYVSRAESEQIGPQWNIAAGARVYTIRYLYEFEFPSTPAF